MRVRLGRLTVTVETANKPVNDGSYVKPLVALHPIPDPEGVRLSKVLGELFFQLGLPCGQGRFAPLAQGSGAFGGNPRRGAKDSRLQVARQRQVECGG